MLDTVTWSSAINVSLLAWKRTKLPSTALESFMDFAEVAKLGHCGPAVVISTVFTVVTGETVTSTTSVITTVLEALMPRNPLKQKIYP